MSQHALLGSSAALQHTESRVQGCSIAALQHTVTLVQGCSSVALHHTVTVVQGCSSAALQWSRAVPVLPYSPLSFRSNAASTSA